MRNSRSLAPAAWVAALSLAIAVLSGLPGQDADAGSAPAVAEEVLQVPVNGTGGQQALFMVNTLERKILVYRTDGGAGGGRLMLNAVRDYKYDLALDEWPPSKGRGGIPTTKDLADMFADTPEYKKDKKEGKANKGIDDWVKTVRLQKEGAGQTLLLTVNPAAGGGNNQADQVWLTDKTYKKILVYTMIADKLSLIAVRKYEYDEKIPWSADFNRFISYQEVKKLWEEEQRKEKEKEKK